MAEHRTLELVVLAQGNAMGDFASGWMPRLQVTIRGTTEPVERKLRELKDRIRAGSCGVTVGVAPDEPAREARLESVWRFGGAF